MRRLATPLGIAVGLLALGPGAASAAQPLTCGQTITHDTTLHADLGPCPGDGLVIGADNVTLDLNGHSVTGPGWDQYVGIKDDLGHHGTVIENGEVHGFERQIVLDDTDYSRVSGITQCCGSDDGGIEVYGSHNLIAHNDVELTFDVIVSGSKNRVRHNHVLSGNGGLIVSGRGNLVAANSERYGEGGVQVSGAGSVIRENILRGGYDASLQVRDCRNVRVEGNFLRNAMRLTGCRHAAVVDNILRRSPNEGIVIDGGSDSTLARNTVSVTIGSGISVIGGSVETAVRGNLAIRAGRTPWGTDPSSDGIHVDDPGTLIANNRANDNADYGIQAVPGAIDGGGNTASGNGNPSQCLNVVCS